MKKIKNPYIDMIIFAFKATLFFYILINIFVFFKYSVIIPLKLIPFFVVMLVITLPVGLIFVLQQQIAKRKIIKEIEKELNEK